MKLVCIRRSIVKVLLAAAIPFASAALANPTVSVNYNPQSVQVSHTGYVGGTQGSRTVNVAVSRRDPGMFCSKVSWIYVYVDVPNSTFQSDHRLFDKQVGSNGLCNFDETIPIELVSSSGADNECGGGAVNAGKTKLLNRSVKVELHYNGGNKQLIDQRTLQAQIKCACTRVGLDSSGIQPNPKAYTEYNNHVPLIRAYGMEPLRKQVTGAVPPGMSVDLDPAYDILYLNGKPTAEGNYTFTANISDSCPHGAQSIQKAFTVPVRCSRFDFPAGMQLPPANVGMPYSYQLRTTCSPAITPQQFSAQYLPAGLAVNSAGLLSGTPTATGKYNVSVQSRSSSSQFPSPAHGIFPLEVRDASPPVVSSFSVMPMMMPSQGGQAAVIVRAADNLGITAVSIALAQPGGQQTSAQAVLASGNAKNGEWRANLAIPANFSNRVLTLGVKAVVSDAANNITTRTAALMVKEGTRTGTTTPAVQGPNTQAAGSSLQKRKPQSIAPGSVPAVISQEPKTPGTIR